MHRRQRRKLGVYFVMALSGGTLFGTCTTRIHDSVIQGTRIFVLSLFDPSNIVITDE